MRNSPLGAPNSTAWQSSIAQGHARSVKGFIVATRFATETKPTIRTTLFAEDPQTTGDGPLGAEDGFELGATVISAHYGEIAAKLNQPVLASALSNGFAVPEDIRFPVTIWTFQMELSRFSACETKLTA